MKYTLWYTVTLTTIIISNETESDIRKHFEEVITVCSASCYSDLTRRCIPECTTLYTQQWHTFLQRIFIHQCSHKPYQEVWYYKNRINDIIDDFDATTQARNLLTPQANPCIQQQYKEHQQRTNRVFQQMKEQVSRRKERIILKNTHAAYQQHMKKHS